MTIWRVALGALAAVLAAGLGLLLLRSGGTEGAIEDAVEGATPHAEGVVSAAGAEGDVAYYSCSMHPSVHASTPGTCPICSMNLVPVSRTEIESGTIRLDARQRQLIGVTTGIVERRPAEMTVRAVGRIAYDEARLTDVTLKYRGWVGNVVADSTGMRVEKGAPLLTVYAPELLSAQEELLESVRRSGTRDGSSRLLESARRRLLLWNLSPAQIAAIARRGEPSTYVAIESPVSGVVVEKNVVDGSAVEPGRLLYRIADLSSVWVEAEVYEADLALVKGGAGATVTLSYLPGERFSATVDYVYPYLDSSTRTGRIRLVVPNPRGDLKPGMYADVALEVPLGDRLVVPEEAVIRAGKTAVVFLDLGEGRLKPQKVEVGRLTPAGYVVLSGLAAGDEVVTSGNFLIAAESKLKAGLDKW